MKKFLLIVFFFALLTGVLSAQEMNLYEVIVSSARAIEDALPHGSMVAILNFVSASETFSDFIIDELTGELVTGRRVTVVDRHNLALIAREMNLQLSGDVSDESAQTIGRMLGAQSIVSGTLTNMGTYFRFRIRVISVETAAIQTQVSLNLRNDTRVAFLLDDNTTRVSAAAQQESARQPAQPRPERTQDGFGASNNMSVKFSLGATIGFCLLEVNEYYWCIHNRFHHFFASGLMINWLSPTFNLRFLYTLENRLHLGFGGNMTLSFFSILLSSPDDLVYPVVSDGKIAPYGIIGYNNFSFHLGYDFVWSALYFSPNFRINERLMIGIPASLFGNNQSGILALIFPPERRVSPPQTYWDIRSNFQFGVSIQYVF
jgi:TolB-like protein